MKRVLTTSISTLALATAAFADGHATSATDLQAAVEAGGIVTVTSDVTLDSTLTYSGTAPLTLVGSGQTISITTDADVFAAPNGADISISGLTFAGPDGFSIENRGDADGAAGKGIFVGVPTDRTGTVTLQLTNVTVQGVANHGVHVSDCSLADACGSGGGGAGDGSAASVKVVLDKVLIDDAGNGKFDADGLRVDERGEGSITLVASESAFTNVGADGVELDEGQAGDVIVTGVNLRFADNGNYCDPALMEAFLPSPDEGEFDQGAFAEADVPPAVTGSLDDGCIEREVDLYDDGSVEEFAFGLDLDDGFDIDEAGEGSIHATLIASTVTGNLDEGLDFDEEDAGDIRLSLNAVAASNNRDDGVKLSEEGAGHTIAQITHATAEQNGGKGFVFEEADAGDLVGNLAMVRSNGNDDSDDTGVEAVQEDDGQGTLTVTTSDIADGFDLDGVDK